MSLVLVMVSKPQECHFKLQVLTHGCAVIENVLHEASLLHIRAEIERVQRQASGQSYAGIRHLLSRSEIIRTLASSGELQALVEPILGPNAFCVRCILFDKSEQANWWVGWHQDLFITVRERIDVPGYTGFWRKEGVLHVKPPAEVLANMLTVRLHVDDCPVERGPLEVIPGSHTWGFLTPDQSEQCAREIAVSTLTAAAGGAILMRPLILHASRKMTTPGQRRVLHFEFAANDLPGGLEWAERC